MVFTTAFAFTHEVKARSAPNLGNRKWLNFQDKIDGKSEVSKPSDVETVETVEVVEGTDATQNDYQERRALDSWTGLSGVESLEGSQFF